MTAQRWTKFKSPTNHLAALTQQSYVYSLKGATKIIHQPAMAHRSKNYGLPTYKNMSAQRWVGLDSPTTHFSMLAQQIHVCWGHGIVLAE